MTQSVPLFIELCAGTAALSLRLHRRHARPPVSRMGAKTGYADAILRVLGLRPGQGATHYVWCEPDPGVRLLLEAYRDADLARAAAAIIRGWAGEEPRALWERLRAEGPPRAGEAGEVARYMRLVTANRLIPGAWDESGRWVNAARNGGPNTRGGLSFGGADFCTPIEALADAAAATPTLPATVYPDARRVDPREVARWAWVQRRSMAGNEDSYLHPYPLKPVADPARQGHRWTPEQPAPLLESLPTLAATIHPDARDLDPGPALPPGTIAYMDPPYVGTTGYAADLPRADVVMLARRWAAAGATVAISEAEPIADLVADGWHAVDITAERCGAKRTFSRQQAEWLTLSAPPVWMPLVQQGLF